MTLILEPETAERVIIESPLQTLAYTRIQVQRLRIGFSNRISAMDRGVSPDTPRRREIAMRYYEAFQNLEEMVSKDMAREVRPYPIYERLIRVKGIGDTLAAKLISQIDIERAQTAPALWRYAGYGTVFAGVTFECGHTVAERVGTCPVCGNENITNVQYDREKREKGVKSAYNGTLKTDVYLCALSFIKSNSPYRRLYDEAKLKYAQTRLDWTKAHQHQAALRVMVKVFLDHLWRVWRELEGLPTRPPYAIEHLNHTTYHDPKDFGW